MVSSGYKGCGATLIPHRQAANSQLLGSRGCQWTGSKIIHMGNCHHRADIIRMRLILDNSARMPDTSILVHVALTRNAFASRFAECRIPLASGVFVVGHAGTGARSLPARPDSWAWPRPDRGEAVCAQKTADASTNPGLSGIDIAGRPRWHGLATFAVRGLEKWRPYPDR